MGLQFIVLPITKYPALVVGTAVNDFVVFSQFVVDGRLNEIAGAVKDDDRIPFLRAIRTIGGGSGNGAESAHRMEIGERDWLFKIIDIQIYN